MTPKNYPTTNLKVLIIGYGSIGKLHASILASMPSVAQLHIVSRHSPTNKFQTYPNLEAVPNLNTYHYLIICTETANHYQQLQYLETKIQNKRILVEKPIFAKYTQITQPKNKILVAYNLRFHPAIQFIQTILTNQQTLYVNAAVGQYLPTWRKDTDYRQSYSASNKKGGGVLLDLSHEIDYLQWLFGQFTTTVAYNNKISSLQIDTDDLATIISKTNQQTIINLSLDYLSRIPFRTITIQTNTTTIKADLIKNQVEIASYPKKIPYPNSGSIPREYTYKQMHNAIINNKFQTITTYQEALQTLQTIAKIGEASRKNFPKDE